MPSGKYASHIQGEVCMGEKPDSGNDVQQLVQIETAKEKAFLPDGEVHEALPREMVVAEELDEVVTTFEEIDLEIDDLPEAAGDGQETIIELLDPGPVEDATEREADVEEYGKDDPVLLYLREMGAVPLLR